MLYRIRSKIEKKGTEGMQSLLTLPTTIYAWSITQKPLVQQYGLSPLELRLVRTEIKTKLLNRRISHIEEHPALHVTPVNRFAELHKSELYLKHQLLRREVAKTEESAIHMRYQLMRKFPGDVQRVSRALNAVGYKKAYVVPPAPPAPIG